MDQDDYLALDATAMAASVRDGDVTPSELLEAAIVRADTVDPRIHAITCRLDDDARDRAMSPLDGPLAGVPFLLKDLFQAQEGVVETAGSRACAGAVASETDTVVARWLDAGAVVFGRTNVPEFGIKGTTEPDLFGPTHNPWDLTRSPGGSSGGSAAAVAAGIVPVAGANDGGGSTRIPAACCGVFGLKPGRGVVPTGPGQGEFFHGGAVTGVVSRTVRDSAAFLDVIRGTDPTAPPYAFASPPLGYVESAQQDPPRLRIGVQVESAIAEGIDPEVVAAVRSTADLLTDMGHTVIEARRARSRHQRRRLRTVSDALARACAGAQRLPPGARSAAHTNHRDHRAATGAYATSALERAGAGAALRARLGRLIASTGAAQTGVLRNLRWVPFSSWPTSPGARP